MPLLQIIDGLMFHNIGYMVPNERRYEANPEFQKSELFDIINHSSIQQMLTFIEQYPQVLKKTFGPFQQTPLFYVLKVSNQRRRISFLQALVEIGVNVNARNMIGQTALNYAVAKNYAKQCEVLLEAGADPSLRDNLQKNVQEYVLDFGHFQLQQIIERQILRRQNEQRDCPLKEQHSEKIIPKYALCRLFDSGREHYLAQNQTDILREQKGFIVQALRNVKRLSPKKFQIGQTWRRVGVKIIDKLWNLKDSFWFRNISETWRIEGDDTETSGIDLNVIRLKLQHNIYQNPREMREDMNNIWVYTKKRLGEDHDTTKHALQLCANFQRFAREFNFNSYIK